MLQQLKLMSAAHGRGARYISKRKCLYIYIYFCVCVSHFSLLLLHGRDGGGWYTQEMSAYRRVITVILPGPEEDGNLTEMVTSLSETVSLASSIYSASVMSSASASYCLIMTLSSPFFLSLFYFCFLFVISEGFDKVHCWRVWGFDLSAAAFSVFISNLVHCCLVPKYLICCLLAIKMFRTENLFPFRFYYDYFDFLRL